MLGKRIGIDLGTANVIVVEHGRGVVLDEPAVVAITERDNIVVAVGDDARAMIGRHPGSIQVIRPMREGVIAGHDPALVAELPCAPGDTLGHVARAGRPHALRKLPGIGQPHSVTRPTYFERVNWLQILELEINLGRSVINVKAYQRRSYREIGDKTLRGPDVFQ